MSVIKTLLDTVEEFRKWEQTAREYEAQYGRESDTESEYVYKMMKEAFHRCAERLDKITIKIQDSL